jgi:diaminopimelate epimerase
VSGTPFFKMTGSGNDFVVLDGRISPPSDWPTDRIVAVCDRRNGAGADGLVILTPEAENSVRMTFFNADGSRAAMCGNAALCSTRLSARLGLGRPEGMELVTDAGTYRTRCVSPTERAEVNLADVALPVPPAGVTAGPGELAISFTVVGVPHLVIRVENVDEVDLPVRGRALRFHPALAPAGANANFVSPPREPGGPWLIRTYERGVEGETLACGTGTVAAALAVAPEAGLPATFMSRGGALISVSATAAGASATDVWLCGEGRLVFEGRLASL